MSEVDVIRIPGSRPIYKQRAELHLREQNWDDRFVLGRIPTYDASRDKHCVALAVATGKKKKTVLAPGKIRRARSPSGAAGTRPPRSGSVKVLQTEGQHVVRGNLLHKLRTDLVEGWTREGVPEELYGPLLRSIESCGLKARVTAFARELEDLRGNKSAVQQLTQTLQAREQSVRLLSSLSAGERMTEEDVLAAKEALLHHRLMTLHAVEHIAVYREHIYQLSPGDRKLFRTPVIFNGNNYLLQLKSDTNFLSTSVLATFFEFSKKSDPFLVMPASGKKGKLELPFPTAILGRVKAAENVILDETYAQKEQRTGSRDAARRAKPPEYPQRRLEAVGLNSSGLPLTSMKPKIETPSNQQDTSSDRDPVIPGSPQRLSTPKQQVLIQSTIPRPVARGKIDLESASPAQSTFGKDPNSAEKKPDFEENPEVKLENFDLEIDDLRLELDRYISSLPISIQESFWAPGAFDTLLKQTYPALISFTRSGQRIGVLGLYIDTLNTSLKRICISHVFSSSISTLETVLDKGLDYIWTTYPCDEVRLAVNYRVTEEGKMEADPAIKAVVGSRKFRWKNLTNTADGRRVINMAVLRPENAGGNPTVSGEFFSENLVIRYGAAVQTGEAELGDESAAPFSYLGLAACLRELGGIGDISTPQNSSQAALLSLQEKLTPDFVFPAFRVSKNEDLEIALDVIKSQNLDLRGLKSGLVTATACSSIGLRFPSFDTCLKPTKSGLCGYMRIIDLEVNCAIMDSRRIFLFPSDDKQFNLLVICGGLEEVLDPLGLASEVLLALTQDQQSFFRTANEIWIPGFSHARKTVLPGVVGLPLKSGGRVQTCVEACEMYMKTPTHDIGNFAIKPGKDSVVVEDTFLLGKTYAAVLNSKLDEVAPVPYCACLIGIEEFNIKNAGES